MPNDPDFVAHGKLFEGRHGSFMKFTFFRDSLVHMLEVLGYKVILEGTPDWNSLTVKVGEKAKASARGFTHYMKVDRWKPDEASQAPEDNGQQAAEDESQLPPDVEEYEEELF